MRRTAYASLLILLCARTLFADEPQKLEKIVVTPSRLTTALGGSSRSVTILDDTAFESAAYKAIPDLIGETGGIDIRRRGPENVQADVSIRGTTFEQNTVLIDGVKVNDPQTGHFNMDLPLTLMDVDRIEILKGPASSLYGANSFGGAINIITRKPAGDKVVLYGEGGSYDYFDGGVSISTPLGPAKNRFSFEQSRSTGYMQQTQFDILSLTNSTLVETGMGIYNFLFGYLNKDFGADSFYSNLYPNEYERTDTRFFKLDGTARSGNLRIEPKLFLRRHKDKFVLDQNRTGWQTNYHTTYTYGGEIDFAVEHEFMDVSYGYELSADTIDSTNLQTHSRTKDGFYIELVPRIIDDLYLNAGFREDYISEFGWQASPTVSGRYAFSKEVALRGSVGRSYRVPTFTDLYYNDAANKGNSSLTPESSWTYEAGLDYKRAGLDSSLVFFHRDSYDTIDWTRSNTKQAWQATNIGSARTNGAEVSLAVYPQRFFTKLPVEKASFQYTCLDTYDKHAYLSKYALDYLKQEITAGADCGLGGFRNSWILNYKKRIGDSGYITVDTKVSKEIVRRKRVVVEAFIEITNLFDVDYSEQSDIPMPGRWIKSGGRMEF